MIENKRTYLTRYPHNAKVIAKLLTVTSGASQVRPHLTYVKATTERGGTNNLGISTMLEATDENSSHLLIWVE